MVDEQAKPRAAPTAGVSAWLKQNRIHWQALVLSIGAPFGLYWALQSGQDGVAVAFFAVIVISLIAVILVG